MLKDIITLTKLITKELKADKKINSATALYDMSRTLHQVIEYNSLVANHYLALRFDKDFLQNSSFGEPIDKWRYFLNKDLKMLNKAIKDYLLTIYNISVIEDEEDYLPFSSIITSKLNCKILSDFIRNEYNIGMIKPCSATMTNYIIDEKLEDDRYIGKHNNIELNTYEQRVELQKYINTQNEILKQEFEIVNEYILSHYRLEDILPKIKNRF